MPTPFMHLQIAEELLAHPGLAPPVRDRLRDHWPAFYLGSVAADVQTVTRQPRAATHFYQVPPATDVVAYDQMLLSYPELAPGAQLSAARAVFVAAYRAHLLADVRWFWDIAQPCFLAPTDWPADHRQRFLIHNILLTFLDGEAVTALPATAADILARAAPAGWLPFVGDDDLYRWRDMLAAQLRPGATLATVTIYAGRMGMEPDTLAAHLADEAWLAERVFQRVPLAQVHRAASRVLVESVHLVNTFLQSG